ncbi:MAG: hypothetical protein HY835_04210 [Anaerolineae bacterium]|nr:hypothetical protein [Anaerolineae bacterium]
MSSIPRVSLEDTLTLMQLMRETALARGQEARAARMAPAAEEMKSLVETARTAPAASAPAGILGQADFKKRLEVTHTRETQVIQGNAASGVEAALERNRMIGAMASANMSDVDIARQFGISREEVRLVLSTQKAGRI